VGRLVEVAKGKSRGRRIGRERRRGNKVPGGLGHATFRPVGLAPPEVSRHRRWPEREGAAEGLDGGSGVAGGESSVTGGEQITVLSVALEALLNQDHARDHDGHRGGEQQDLPHRRDLTAAGTFGADRGLTTMECGSARVLLWR